MIRNLASSNSAASFAPGVDDQWLATDQRMPLALSLSLSTGGLGSRRRWQNEGAEEILSVRSTPYFLALEK
jgi:hypothetical protein